MGEARVGTALPGRRSGAHDPDRRPDLGDDQRARHLVADALSGVGDPQWPAKWRIVQMNHRRPSRDNTRASSQKLTGFREGTADRKRRRHLHRRFVFIGVRIRSRVHDAQSPANERTSTVSPPVYPATTDMTRLAGEY